MARWRICPYWVAERRSLSDDSGRVYQIDYQVTELRITNPTDRDGVVDLVFYEARGDGNFYRSDWASGTWTAPPSWQRYYRPDPSRVFGDRFITYGWFEAWTSLNQITIDVSVSAISRNLVSGGPVPGAGGVVENISQRTVNLIPKPIPLLEMIPEIVDRLRGTNDRSRIYAPGQLPSDDLTVTEPLPPGTPPFGDI